MLRNRTFIVAGFITISAISPAFSSQSNLSTSSSLNEWTTIYQANEVATGPAGFVILQKKHPDTFAKVDIQKVVSANLMTVLYEFKGRHTCPAKDPRLMFEAKSFSLCQLEGKEEICMTTDMAIPNSGDPCKTK